MVAETYSDARRAMAKSIGLGRKAGHKVEKAAGSGGEEGSSYRQSGAECGQAGARHGKLIDW